MQVAAYKSQQAFVRLNKSGKLGMQHELRGTNGRGIFVVTGTNVPYLNMILVSMLIFLPQNRNTTVITC